MLFLKKCLVLQAGLPSFLPVHSVVCLSIFGTYFPNLCPLRNCNILKVRKTTRIRNRYNQVPHLSQDTKWKSIKITINNTNKSQEVSPFPSGDHKAAMNRRKSMANTRHK